MATALLILGLMMALMALSLAGFARMFSKTPH